MKGWWQRRRGEEPRLPATPGSQTGRVGGTGGKFDPSLLAAVRAQAEAGDPEAMANLGAHFYQQGDHAQGIRWSELAWQAGNLMAGFNLGTFYVDSGDTHRADLVWTEAAERGDPDAMMCVARLALRRNDRSVADRWLVQVLGQDQPYRPSCASTPPSAPTLVGDRCR